MDDAFSERSSLFLLPFFMFLQNARNMSESIKDSVTKILNYSGAPLVVAPVETGH